MSHPHIYTHGLTGRTIRLLAIELGPLESPLRCTLQEACLDDTSSSYNALSYCWGAGRSPVQLICNSHALQITPNLYSALLEYRRRAIDTPLWVDAVCIDQSNTAERTSQVRMMQTIYSKAARVVVWLGEAEATDGPALELLKAINAPWAKFRDPRTGREMPLFTGQDDASHDAQLAARVPDAYFDALAAFLMKPWFSRIWIVQELICASELAIWCGQDTLNEDFPVLEASSRLFTMYNCNVKTQLATITLEDKEAQGAGRSKLMCAGRLWGFKSFRDRGLSGILWYLLITRSFDATDPRDKMFALVGLADDVDEEFVDYSKCYEDVVRELSHMILDGRIETTSGSALDIWSCITREEGDDISQPSWVVDWLKLKDSLYTPLMGQYESERTVIQRNPDIEYSGTDKEETLRARGTIFDAIKHIVPSPIAMRQLVPQSDFLNSQHVSGLHDWHTHAINVIANASSDEIVIYEPTGESLYDAFWRTLCCNRSIMNGSEPPADDRSYIAWQHLLKLQRARQEMEVKYRRTCKLQKRLLWGVVSMSISALTYHFRRNKLLFCVIPFSLPPLIQFINRGWDLGLQILLLNLFKDYMQQSTQTQIDQRDFENSHNQWTQGRQFGVTEQGLMGWVPLAARVGDNVGLFAGCRIPYVLRVCQDGYKIVGDAYLHGVMNGEGEQSEGEMLRIY